MQNHVFILNPDRSPSNPVTSGTARALLNQGKASVFKRYPFTLILKEASNSPIQSLQVKLDPGSKVTGFAILRGSEVIWAAELEHRGDAIKSSLEKRASERRGRRARKTRYRKKRFDRSKPEGWLPPSLLHRIETCATWVRRLISLSPVASIAMELVKFDTQKMVNPEVSGVEYQQGELAGYEVREYLLEKWGRKCAYCAAENTPLEIDHIHPRSKGGSDRVSNLTLACHKCNQRKGNKAVEEFLKGSPDVLTKIKAKAQQPLKDAAAVNSTRRALFNRLKEFGLPVSTGSGAKTKFNRRRNEIEKSHWADAACVGEIETVTLKTHQPLHIKATGHGSRKMANTKTGEGFPLTHKQRVKFHFGFQTGDIVRAIITRGKNKGTYVGRVAVRASGTLQVKTDTLAISPHHSRCTALHRNDGYTYSFQKPCPSKKPLQSDSQKPKSRSSKNTAKKKGDRLLMS